MATRQRQLVLRDSLPPRMSSSISPVAQTRASAGSPSVRTRFCEVEKGRTKQAEEVQTEERVMPQVLDDNLAAVECAFSATYPSSGAGRVVLFVRAIKDKRVGAQAGHERDKRRQQREIHVSEGEIV